MEHDWAWLNGRWIPAQQLALPVWDAGLIYAATVTDLCRTIGHRLFRWHVHLQRFFTSAELCDIPIFYSAEELTQIAEELVRRQTALLAPLEDLALVLVATPGSVPQYQPIATSRESPDASPSEPTLALHTFRLPLARYARLWHQGFHLVSVPLAVPDSALPRRAKHRSRLHWWRAQRHVERLHPGATALLCDADGSLLETSFANLVLVVGDTLISSDPNRVLPGISVQVVAELVNTLGYSFHYRIIQPDDVHQATEAFLTSSSFCLLPIRQIDDRTFPCPGPVTQQLLAAWSELVSFDLLAQLNAFR
ncbi:MAG: aminotransferase class IV [Gemmatales bacterium]|nr:aminotransferase class IV [Gemmatales bacterium]